MLVFMRRNGERVVIDNHVEVVVLEIRGNQVKLGIRAPREIPVHRGEVHDSIQDELGVEFVRDDTSAEFIEYVLETQAA